MSNSNLYSGKRFRLAVVHFLLGRTAQGIASFIFTLWLVRELIPADYGVYMVLWGMVDMMMPLSSLGMLEAVRRFLPELATRGAPGVLMWFVRWMMLIRFAILLAWVALIFTFWSDIASWMGFDAEQQETTKLAAWLIVTVISFRYASEMLECLLEQRWSQLMYAFMPLGRLSGLAILVFTDNLTLDRLICIDLSVSCVCFLLTEFILIRKLRSITGTGDYRVSVREIFVFSWDMAGVNLLRAIASAGSLRILVARTLGLEAAGMFAFLQQLLMVFGRYLPANLLANIIRPMLISRYVAGEVEMVKQGMALLWKSNLMIICAIMSVMCVAGDAVIGVISSERFQDAGLLMMIMLLGLGATSQGQLVVMIMQIFLYTRQLSYFSVLSIFTPLAVIAGSAWGLLGVASGIAISVWFMNSLILNWLNRQTGRIELDWSSVAKGVLLAVVTSFIGLVIKYQFGTWWALACVLAVYGPGLFLIKPLNQFDMVLLNLGLRHRARFLTPFARHNF